MSYVVLARKWRPQSFEDLVVDAAEKIEAHLVRMDADASLAGVEYTVIDVPHFPAGEEPAVVPFGRIVLGGPDRPHEIVIYRRSIELRSEEGDERAELVHDAVVEQVTDLLGMVEDDIDPGYE